MKLLDRKFFFFSGKGGVGKTTVSSAMAVALADEGFKTLLVSLDPAHSLSLALSKKVPEKPGEVEKNLWAVEANLEREMREYLKKVEREAEKVVTPVLLEDVKRQIQLAYYSPGAKELAMLDVIHTVFETSGEKFEKVVFDTAPSGYTLRLILLPELLSKWLDRLMSLRRQAISYMKMAGETVEEDPVMAVLERRKETVENLRRHLSEGGKTLFAIVTTPGSMAMAIAEKTLKELESAGIKVEVLVLNRFGGETPAPLKKLQRGRTLIRLREAGAEPTGVKALKSLGQEVLAQMRLSL